MASQIPLLPSPARPAPRRPISVRLTLPHTTGLLVKAAVGLHALMLISANVLWDKKQQRFAPAPSIAYTHDVALDSAGFAVMVNPAWRGEYPWSVADYVDLADGVSSVRGLGNHMGPPWAWYSSMDYCVEPQVAQSRQEVLLRVQRTADKLAEIREEVDSRHDEGMSWARYPMPILQGWLPDDYAQSVQLTDEVLAGDWPTLVGIGSVCRRDVFKQYGLLAVLEKLDRVVPKGVRFHLFGVKGSALVYLTGHPRIASIDSAAWDAGARHGANQIRRDVDPSFSNTLEHRAAWMRQWYEAQQERLSGKDATGMEPVRGILRYAEAQGRAPTADEILHALRLTQDARARAAVTLGVVEAARLYDSIYRPYGDRSHAYLLRPTAFQGRELEGHPLLGGLAGLEDSAGWASVEEHDLGDGRYVYKLTSEPVFQRVRDPASITGKAPLHGIAVRWGGVQANDEAWEELQEALYG